MLPTTVGPCAHGPNVWVARHHCIASVWKDVVEWSGVERGWKRGGARLPLDGRGRVSETGGVRARRILSGERGHRRRRTRKRRRRKHEEVRMETGRKRRQDGDRRQAGFVLRPAQ